MKKKRFAVEHYYEAVTCECGGLYNRRSGHGIMMNSPPQAVFECDRCGKEIQLSEDDWPGIKATALISRGPTEEIDNA
ncbi:MAG: hypothetical protein WD492_12810 [Alkalispirochaeta sp.]